MGKKLAIVLAVTALGALALAGLRFSSPASYRLERATTIAAPPAA